MSLAFIELWNPKPKFIELPPAEQDALVANLISKIAGLDGPGGIEMQGWGFQLPDLDHPAPYQLFAIWRVPRKEDMSAIQAVLREAGWYEYVDQVNVAGELVREERDVRDCLRKFREHHRRHHHDRRG